MFHSNQDLPLHELVLHFRISSDFPIQSLPSSVGEGLLQSRTRFCVPFPQVWVHVEYKLQNSHSPFANKERNYLKKLWIQEDIKASENIRFIGHTYSDNSWNYIVEFLQYHQCNHFHLQKAEDYCIFEIFLVFPSRSS